MAKIIGFKECPYAHLMESSGGGDLFCKDFLYWDRTTKTTTNTTHMKGTKGGCSKSKECSCRVTASPGHPFTMESGNRNDRFPESEVPVVCIATILKRDGSTIDKLIERVFGGLIVDSRENNF